MRNALAKSRFRDRPLARRASRTLLEKDNSTRAVAQLIRAKIVSAEPGPRKQSFRLRSARGWICRLAGCPRDGCLCQRPPVRASCRPDIHSSRPLPLPWSNPTKLADLRAPFHAAKTTAARSVSVRDAGDDTSPIAAVKNKKGTPASYLSENQKQTPEPGRPPSRLILDDERLRSRL